MCGIAGIYQPEGFLSDPETLLNKMLSCIRHRGPDESGMYIETQAALGSVRLSIIDLQTGRQPISSQDGKYWIVLNGEIFNYIEIRSDLEKLGHHFLTESDTEVLLHAYIEYGAECLDLLNGQFACAIWNNEKKEFFLARDRVGIRPLFYTRSGDTVVFSSEIKALLVHPDVKAEIDPVSLSQVFTFWTTITPRTVFKNIFEVPPGHFVIINRRSLQIRKYWSLHFPPEHGNVFRGSITEAADHLDHLLTDAVRLRLRADVYVAAYLSGGLDSSATTSYIKKLSPDMLQTFSIAFEDKEFDESIFQQEVSAYLDTRHSVLPCTMDDIGKYFPQMTWHAEIPVLRSAPVPMFCLSKKVRESNIKVVITGEGADEMLGGYGIFKEAIIRNFWARQPDSRYRPLLFNKLYPYLAQFQGKNKSLLKLFYGYRLGDTGSPYYSHLLRWHNTAGILHYLTPEIQAQVNGIDHESELGQWIPEGFDRYDLLSKAQWLETFLFMSGYLLSSQGDRMAMANSVEGRYPFLDHRVIEFTASLPADFKLKGLTEKYILKKIMHGRLPENVLNRPKLAYRAPLAAGLFSASAHGYVAELLNEKDIDDMGIFSPHAVQKLIDKVETSQQVTEMENMTLAGIISTQLISHQFVRCDKYRPTPDALDNYFIHNKLKTIDSLNK